MKITYGGITSFVLVENAHISWKIVQPTVILHNLVERIGSSQVIHRSHSILIFAQLIIQNINRKNNNIANSVCCV